MWLMMCWVCGDSLNQSNEWGVFLVRIKNLKDVRLEAFGYLFRLHKIGDPNERDVVLDDIFILQPISSLVVFKVFMWVLSFGVPCRDSVLLPVIFKEGNWC